jgi:hypothetical protein
MRILNFFVALMILVHSTGARAETHGGVSRSNGAFQAVAKYALAQGGSLDRVFGINKLYRIECDRDIYKITWGGMSSDGVEHAGSTPIYVAVQVEGVTKSGTPQFKVQELEKPVCPK